MGWKAFEAGREIGKCIMITISAKSEEDLDNAAEHLATAVIDIGVVAFMLLLHRLSTSRGKGGPKEQPPVKPPPETEPPAPKKPVPKAEEPEPKPVTPPQPPTKFDPKQVQAKFKHAKDFGVEGNYNKQTAAAYESALKEHIESPETQTIKGTYRGKPVIHKYNPTTGNNVMLDPDGNFISGWKLSPDQAKALTTTGNLGGG